MSSRHHSRTVCDRTICVRRQTLDWLLRFEWQCMWLHKCTYCMASVWCYNGKVWLNNAPQWSLSDNSLNHLWNELLLIDHCHSICRCGRRHLPPSTQTRLDSHMNVWEKPHWRKRVFHRLPFVCAYRIDSASRFVIYATDASRWCTTFARLRQLSAFDYPIGIDFANMQKRHFVIVSHHYAGKSKISDGLANIRRGVRVRRINRVV